MCVNNRRILIRPYKKNIKLWFFFSTISYDCNHNAIYNLCSNWIIQFFRYFLFIFIGKCKKKNARKKSVACKKTAHKADSATFCIDNFFSINIRNVRVLRAVKNSAQQISINCSMLYDSIGVHYIAIRLRYKLP